VDGRKEKEEILTPQRSGKLKDREERGLFPRRKKKGGVNLKEVGGGKRST